MTLRVRTIFRGAERMVDPVAWPRDVSRAAIAWNASPAVLSMVFGAMEAGAQLALLNTRLTEAEREVQLAALGLSEKVNSVHFLDGDVNAVHFPDGHVNVVHIKKRPADGDPATLLFTSGTTGAAKAAILPLDSHLANARAAIEVLGIDDSSRFLCAMPLFHVGGLGTAFRCALAGATLLLHERFDAAAVARELQTGATHASLVAATLARVLDTGATFPATVRAILVGGGAVPKPLLERARKAGLPVAANLRPDRDLLHGHLRTARRSRRRRPPAARCRGLTVRHSKTAKSSSKVRSVMRGYEGHPKLEGPFHTGDLGELDARGRLTIHSRRVDLIVSGGENIYPAEVEAALLSHPAVKEAAVLPAPDERWGQVGVAYVVTTAAESELREHLRGLLARYKIPARFEKLPELPRNASGKVDRQQAIEPAVASSGRRQRCSPASGSIRPPRLPRCALRATHEASARWPSSVASPDPPRRAPWLPSPGAQKPRRRGRIRAGSCDPQGARPSPGCG